MFKLPTRRRFAALALALTPMFVCAAAQAGMGMTQIPATDTAPLVTVYYPSSAAEQPFSLGSFAVPLARNGAPVRGNGRLVVLSHGTAGSPWAFADLARGLVNAGFVVALPEHRGDNYKDDSGAGPVSFARRPLEVSRSIDAVAQDPRFAALVDTRQVGLFGNSAGGHTVLAMVGGKWSPAGFVRHCEAHLAEDFQSCVGLLTRLNGGWLDGLKKWAAMAYIRQRFSDPTLQTHDDPRIAVAAASVPWAADFEMATLARPRVPLALVTMGQDRWTVPRFHSARVLQACKTCEEFAMPTAGHGAMLSPLPPHFTGLVADMLNDPPGFDRAQTAQVISQLTAYYAKLLPPLTAAAQAERPQP